MAFLSIIIPFYNQNEFIEECISSVYSSTFKNFEVILIDDGSVQEESNIKNLIKYNNLKYFRIENSGVSYVRNYGASLSSGEYLMFLDADDKISSSYLEIAINIFKENPNVDYVYSDLIEFGDSNSIRIMEDILNDSYLLYCPTHVSGIIKRKLWNKLGGFDVDMKNGWEDWDLIIRMNQYNFDFKKINKPLFFYRIKKVSKDKLSNLYFKDDLEKYIFKKYLQLYLTKYKNIISILKEYEIIKNDFVQLEKYKIEIQNSYSYKLGNIILSPLKIVKKYLFG